MRTIKLVLFALLTALLFVNCSSHRHNTTSKSTNGKSISLEALKSKTGNTTSKTSSGSKSSSSSSSTMRGGASYYADKYDGRKTASGEIFRQNKLTAAHRTLSFGTMVRVKNLKNGKTVDVKINDRGPFVSGRIIDLSRAAAEKIDLVRDGVAEVEVTIL